MKSSSSALGGRRAFVAGAGLAILGLSACSASVHFGSSTPSISKSSLESKIASLIKAKGVTAKVSCSGNLTAKVGSTQQCTLTADNGQTATGTAKVDSISGHTANFTFDVQGNSGSSGTSVSNSGSVDTGASGSTGSS